MTKTNNSLPKWILLLSALFALMEVGVAFSLWFSPQSVAEMVDLNAKGVDYLMQIWAVRQLALGIIFGFATIKRSAPMLTLAYLFFLIMFAGDLVIGIVQNETTLTIAALVMCVISGLMLFVLNRRKKAVATTF